MASSMPDIQISVSRDAHDVDIAVDRRWKNVEFSINKGGKSYLPYTGPYEANASFYYDQKLETYGRVMTDDVTVKRIPVVETSNPQGGKTILIGA